MSSEEYIDITLLSANFKQKHNTNAFIAFEYNQILFKTRKAKESEQKATWNE